MVRGVVAGTGHSHNRSTIFVQAGYITVTGGPVEIVACIDSYVIAKHTMHAKRGTVQHGGIRPSGSKAVDGRPRTVSVTYTIGLRYLDTRDIGFVIK